MRSESAAIAAIKSGERTLDDYGAASTSEWLTLCLALARYDGLEGTGYEAHEAAWDRLNDRQRAIVRAENPTFRAAEFDGPSRYL
ncbi:MULTISPECIES: hypothetical protein [unclassified Aureimonas]|uniref:hypothetical protein n=1 Tax=unclassified Aureimonas TaxID=2615206 RepID=UPI0006F3FC36|nr:MULTISPECIES: hypothetical protein [unclassified Aureimonas]KQT64153.1 hypothetical protein ASG62_03920 [Aureimonas sp. Leaf427]KQT81342.1 hypothetical protein ASG54_01190 [Aureimonas sp. Leaf460]